MTPDWVAKEMTAGWQHVDRARDFAARKADCWGFVMWCSQQYLGRVLPDLLDEYEGVHDTASAVYAAKRQFVEVPRNRAALGDVALTHYVDLFHAGLCTGSGHMIQLSRRSRVTHPSIEPGTPTGRRVEGIYRYVG